MRPSIVCQLAILLGCALVTSALPNTLDARNLYEEFKREFNKVTANEEDDMRFAIFRNNLDRIEEEQRQEQGTAQYGITEFADLTVNEFRNKYLTARMPNTNEQPASIIAEDLPNAPNSFDWRLKGAVGPVEDQNPCGSCWAFSVVGNIEGQWFRKTGKLMSLSKQQLVDCDKIDAGCDGGYPPDTYNEIKRLGGLVKTTDYPYTARDGYCKLNKKQIVVHIDSSITLRQDERLHAAYLVERGPLATVMNGGRYQFYKKGIMQASQRYCPASRVNHAVLTVGYGVEGSIPYWIIKNSWGRHFGENGYLRLYRGDNTCGINTLTTSAIIY